MNIEFKELATFLEGNPQMSLAPSNYNEYVVKGILSLDIKSKINGDINDEFLIKIVIPKCFPKEIPKVFELENKFPKTADYHTFIDESLCLGTPLSIKKRLNSNPSLDGYIYSCVVPYFYAIALKLQGRDNFIYGELSHGLIGIIEDYLSIFNLKTFDQIIQLFYILSLKPNKGNKMICPCGCNRRVTKCKLHKKIVEYRGVWTRKEYTKEKEAFIKIYAEIIKHLKINSYKRPIPYA